MRFERSMFHIAGMGKAAGLSRTGDRLTRFTPNHIRQTVTVDQPCAAPARDTAHDTDRATARPISDRDTLRPGSEVPVHPTPAREEPEARHHPMPHFAGSNEGTDEVPLSVLRRALPERFKEIDAGAENATSFPLYKTVKSTRMG